MQRSSRKQSLNGREIGGECRAAQGLNGSGAKESKADIEGRGRVLCVCEERLPSL